MSDECKGCWSYNVNGCRAGLELHTKLPDGEYECPCFTCLVKGICTSYCDDIVNYRAKFLTMLWKDLKLEKEN